MYYIHPIAMEGSDALNDTIATLHPQQLLVVLFILGFPSDDSKKQTVSLSYEITDVISKYVDFD